MIEDVFVNNIEVATIIRNIKTNERVNFFTKPSDQLQIGAFNMKKGEKIQPHMHLENKRELFYTAEVLLVKKGILTVIFYSEKDVENQRHELCAGDTILLKAGIHGFSISEDCEFIEIKQGPFTENLDKIKL